MQDILIVFDHAFESFLEELNAHNVNSAAGKNGKPLVANSLYVADDAKQRRVSLINSRLRFFPSLLLSRK